MLDFQEVILAFIFLLNLSIGTLVALKDWKNKINVSFWFFAFFIALWALMVFLFRVVEDNITALFLIRLDYIAAGFIGVSFWFFAESFTARRHKRWIFSESTPILLLAIIISFLILSGNFLVESLRMEPWGRALNVDPISHVVFSVYFISLFFGGLATIWSKYIKVKGIDHLQLGYIFWGVLIPGILGSIFNLILASPWFEVWRFIWLGPVFTTIFVLATGIAIVKHRMLNVRVIAAELLTTILIILFGVEIFVSTSLAEVFFRVILFVLVLGFGILLVRSVINEVKRREEMERLKNALEIAYAKLKELDQAKTDFLSMASHQLRSPLTVVRLGLGALMEGTFGELKDKRQMDAAQKMLESATRLINLIGEYLNVSRIELGKMKYDFKEQDLCLLLKDVTEEYQPRAKQKGLKLTFGVAPHPRPLPQGERGIQGIPKVSFDEEKMRHVIVNMIDNAIKYTPKGSITVNCELTTVNQAPWVQFSVKDTGLGMEPEDIAVLFQKFRRTSSSNMRRREGEPIEGSGLGLHVAKMFVDKHGGRIWAQSPGRGKGSTFFVALPLSGPPPLSSEEMGEGGKGVELPR